jgi:hypothetical protein
MGVVICRSTRSLGINRMNASLTTASKLLAWFAVVNGILTILTPVGVPLLTGQQLPTFAVVLFVLIGVASFVSGVYALRARPWAFVLLFLIFLVQCAEYQSETAHFSLIGPLSLKFGFGWKSPPSWLNVNVLAIVVCVWALYALDQVLPKQEATDA